MDFSNYAGLIEFFVVIAFAIGWGILELVGLRMDRKRDAEKANLDVVTPERHNPEIPLSRGARHPER